MIADTVDELYEKGGKPNWCPIVEAEIDEDELTIYPSHLVVTAKWEKCDYKTFEHGFIETHYDKGIYCTNCRYGFKSAELKVRLFCPSCGAKMDGGDTT